MLSAAERDQSWDSIRDICTFSRGGKEENREDGEAEHNGFGGIFYKLDSGSW